MVDLELKVLYWVITGLMGLCIVGCVALLASTFYMMIKHPDKMKDMRPPR